jgi:RNA polymerase sigma-70 factor (ECF subfamily)
MTTTHSIHQRFREELRGFVTKHVRNPTDAEDVLQKVFLNVHRSLMQSEPPENLRAWLYTIARNAVVDQARARRSGDQAADESIAAVDDTLEASDEMTASLSKCIRPMVEGLPTEYRDALVWTELDGLTQAAAAERAGISLSGMKSRVQRGRERLREALLDCCSVELDQRRQPIDFRKREGSTGCSGCNQ